MIPAGLAIGAVVVVWQAAQTVEAESLSARFIEGYERLGSVVGGGDYGWNKHRIYCPSTSRC